MYEVDDREQTELRGSVVFWICETAERKVSTRREPQSPHSTGVSPQSIPKMC
jgi:hypothetical protein